jgi:hypothetical protein
VLLTDSRLERQFVTLLELSGIGRAMANGIDKRVAGDTVEGS